MTEQSLAAMDEICDLIAKSEADSAGRAATLSRLAAEKCRKAMKLPGLDGRDSEWFRSKLAECCAKAKGPLPLRPKEESHA